MRGTKRAARRGMPCPSRRGAVPDVAPSTGDPSTGDPSTGDPSTGDPRSWVRVRRAWAKLPSHLKPIACIGEGTSSRVHSARLVTKTTTALVALKQLRPELAADPAALARFVCE